MALIKCKECGQSIAKSAKTCPQCGAPNRARTSGCAWLFLIGVVGFFVFWMPVFNAISEARSPSERRADRQEVAFDVTKRLVEHQLGLIRTPEFNPPRETRFVEMATDEAVYWKVSGWVRRKPGASEEEYEAVLRVEGSGFTPLVLLVENNSLMTDEVFGELPPDLERRLFGE